MSGIEILNALSAWTIAVLVLGGCVCFSVGLQLLARWRFGVELLAANHEVAGFKYAVVGVAYAVLLAFVVIVVWSEFERTGRAVHAEAERLFNLHRVSFNFPDETGQRMRRALISYAVEVRDKDWPQMEIGLRGSPAVAESQARLSRAIGQSNPESLGLLPSVMHAINLMQQISDYRLERLSDVGGQVKPVIWGVLLFGVIITLAYPAFFATRYVTAQILMTAGLAAIIGSTLFLTIILNYPFSGPERLTSKPISDAIQRMLTDNGDELEMR
ncbi:DUF4239 domain-containing protein [Methylocystis sp.]|uniref:bestrophin-like domain n=1 Tax=Methylocystis sp. TaxID=1911079 RepID=UPI003D1371BD